MKLGYGGEISVTDAKVRDILADSLESARPGRHFEQPYSRSLGETDIRYADSERPVNGGPREADELRLADSRDGTRDAALENAEEKRGRTGEEDGIKGTDETGRFGNVSETDGFKETSKTGETKEIDETDGIKGTSETGRFGNVSETDGFEKTSETGGIGKAVEADAPEETGETDGPEKTGGSYDEVFRDGEGDRYEVHHMPADSASSLEREDGPAIKMEKEDHRKTASCGSSREAREYRAQQKELIEHGNFREALQMDIDDIHEKFGGKYDDAIDEMLEYVDKLEEEGKISG